MIRLELSIQLEKCLLRSFLGQNRPIAANTIAYELNSSIKLSGAVDNKPDMQKISHLTVLIYIYSDRGHGC